MDLQLVSHPDYRENQFWVLGVLFQLLAQAGNVHINRARESAIFIAPDLVPEIASRQSTRYYLSTKGSKRGAQQLNGSRSVPSLAAGATSSGTVSVMVSSGTATGTYYLLA